MCCLSTLKRIPCGSFFCILTIKYVVIKISQAYVQDENIDVLLLPGRVGNKMNDST